MSLKLGSFVTCQKPSVEDRKCSVAPAQKGPVLVDNLFEAVVSGVEGGHQDRALAFIFRVSGDGRV